MTVETATYINTLVATNPGAADPKSEGDDHLRLIKAALKASFPNIAGAMPVAHDQVASKGDIATAQFTTALPGQASNAGKFLSTDGATASWQQAYPTQAANAGKFLVTDGTSMSWSGTLKASVLRLADGTDATKLATFDLSSLTTGTTRTYALPDGSGTLALRSDTAMQLLASAPISGTPTNIDFLNIFTASYDKYVLEMQGVTRSVAAAILLYIAKSGAADTGNNIMSMSSGGTTTTATPFHSLGTSVSGKITATVEFTNTNDSSAYARAIHSQVATYDSSSASAMAFDNVSLYIASNSISGFRLTASGGGTFTGGTVRIYGIKNS